MLKGMLTAFVLVTVILWTGELVFSSKESARPPATTDDLLHAAKAMRLDDKNPSDLNAPLAAFGKKLFFDPGFSKNQQISCATCHQPDKSFTDGKPVAVGLAATTKNTPTLINMAASSWFFHDGRADSLAMQALGPTENPKEHGFSRIEVASRIRSHYRADYEQHFGSLPSLSDLFDLEAEKPPVVSEAVAAYALATLGSVDFLKKLLSLAQKDATQPIYILQNISAGTSIDDVKPQAVTSNRELDQVFANFGLALAAFEQTIRTHETPFDQFAQKFVETSKVNESFVEGFGESEFNGFSLFVGEGNCALCHQGPHLTDQQFHNIGLPAASDQWIDLGRAQGILHAKTSPFNCLGPYLKQEHRSESCGELAFVETELSEFVGAFKTPTLRNLIDTAPYGHDGRFKNLRDILTHYNELSAKPAVGHREESLVPLNFSTQQLDDLEAFLISLQSPVSFLGHDAKAK